MLDMGVRLAISTKLGRTCEMTGCFDIRGLADGKIDSGDHHELQQSLQLMASHNQIMISLPSRHILPGAPSVCYRTTCLLTSSLPDLSVKHYHQNALLASCVLSIAVWQKHSWSGGFKYDTTH